MLKTYKYRIYPNNKRKQSLAHHFGYARWVYNWVLANTKFYYEKEGRLSRRDSLPLLVRVWTYICGVRHDRDIHAAKVIRNRALADVLRK